MMDGTQMKRMQAHIYSDLLLGTPIKAWKILVRVYHTYRAHKYRSSHSRLNAVYKGDHPENLINDFPLLPITF